MISLSVCLSASISLEPLDRLARKFVYPCGRGSLPYVCTSGFMDDGTFGRNGRDAERWRLTRAATAMNDVAIPGRSLMHMNACFVIVAFLPPLEFFRTLTMIFLLLFKTINQTYMEADRHVLNTDNDRHQRHTCTRRLSVFKAAYLCQMYYSIHLFTCIARALQSSHLTQV